MAYSTNTPRRRILEFFAVAAAALAALALALFALLWAFVDWDASAASAYPGGAILRDRAGSVMRVSLGEGDVDCRPWYEADPGDWIVKAVVASEDKTFWTHCGVRPLSMARALAQNLFSRRRVSGASTISMQAVRLIAPHRKSYFEKALEAVRAMKMERVKSKRWILSQYLNRAPFGSNFVGIEAASRGWFGKGAKDLGPGEAALLAGIVQAPSRYRPDRGMDRALKRRDYVLSRMVELGYLTEEQCEGAKGVVPEVKRSPRPFLAPHYCDWYLAEVLKEKTGDFTTPLDPDIQAMAEKTVKEASAEGGYQSAAIVVRVDTLEVVAMAVSGDYFDKAGGQVNTAASPRPAGSTLKPFLAAQAIRLGYAGSESTLLDAPVALSGYRPANFDGSWRGKVSLRESLILSLNLPFVRMLREVGVGRFASCLRDLGFAHITGSDADYGLGLAIGNAEVTLVELTRAYARLAASGTCEAWIVADILSGEERSAAALGHMAEVQLPKFAWKTGTSAAYRDAWTVAWNPEYAIGVWCGHLSGVFGDKSLTGAAASAPRAWEIARAIYPSGRGPWFEKPAGVELYAQRRLPEAPAAGTSLEIAKPAKGTVFRLVKGASQQRLVASPIGNREGERLWWFLDGAPAGETEGLNPFTAELAPGRHVLSCADSEGRFAETEYTVEE